MDWWSLQTENDARRIPLSIHANPRRRESMWVAGHDSVLDSHRLAGFIRLLVLCMSTNLCPPHSLSNHDISMGVVQVCNRDGTTRSQYMAGYWYMRHPDGGVTSNHLRPDN